MVSSLALGGAGALPWLPRPATIFCWGLRFACCSTSVYLQQLRPDVATLQVSLKYENYAWVALGYGSKGKSEYEKTEKHKKI